LRREQLERHWVDDETAAGVELSSPPADDDLTYTELSAAITHAIEQLPERCRLTFLLSRHEGLSYQEIAKVLGVSVKTVEMQMGRALKALRIRIGPLLG